MTLELRIFGVRVRVHFLFLVTAFMLGVLQPEVIHDVVNLGVWMLIVFVGVLMHELGHALTGRVFGWKPQVDLVWIGGFTQFDNNNEVTHASPWRRMLMIFNGPLAGILIGLVALGILQ